MTENSELIAGRWYWVRLNEFDTWYPAMHDTDADGGWTDLDAWEDSESEVTQWSLLPEPPS